MAEDELSYQGLTTKPNSQLVEEIQAEIQNIYSQNGEEINFDSNTPDGQITQILSEMGSVIRELATDIYNSFDPTKCSGAVQDSRYQINYLTRKQGSYTIQYIDVTVNQPTALSGLDSSYNDSEAAAYTVSDNNGNLWYLIDSTNIYSGTVRIPFRAKEKGEVRPVIGTITNQVTIVQGVTNVINNVGAASIGKEEESDSDFRIRREQSLYLASGNNEDTILARILELNGVESAKVYSNKTNSTDANGIPAHSVWIIVNGGSNEDIADIIYENLAGSGMKGNHTEQRVTASMQTIDIKFDRQTEIPLYIRFDLQSTTSDLSSISQAAIKTYIGDNLKYEISQEAETSKITEIAAEAILLQGGGAYAINVEISTGGTATTTIGTSTGITAAATNIVVFQAKVADTAGTYTFTYDGADWKLSGNVVDLDDYGITYTGTPASSDQIIVVYTASVWEDYIEVSSLADQFVTDETKITITPIVS